MIKLSDYVMQYFQSKGINTVYMLSGGGCMHLVDSVGKSGMKYVCCLHEQAAGIAALAHSQYMNDIGLALVTTGPGGTNAVTAVAGAWTDSVPLFILSGQVKTADLSSKVGTRTRGFQEIDIVSVVKPITKYAVTVTDPGTIKYHLDSAYRAAKEGRPGPVWIDIPLDVQSSMIDETELVGNECEVCTQEKDFDVSSVINKLKEAERPVILAGHGIRLAGAYEDFVELVEELQIPVLTSWKVADFFKEDYPLYVGRPGIAGQRGANFTIQNCDLLLAIGARMDFGQIGFEHATFARCAKKIIVDVDPNELKKFGFVIDMPICADAKQFIDTLLSKRIGTLKIDSWRKKCREWNDKYPVIDESVFEVNDGISTYALTELLSTKIDGSFVFSPSSSGASAEIPMQCFRVRSNLRIVNSPGLGSMGFCVPTTIGLAVSSEKKVVCITGDGGFEMNVQDLETIHRLKLPVLFFVMNNNGYGSIMNTQRSLFNGHLVGANPESGVTLPELRKIANTFNFDYHIYADIRKLESDIDDILELKKPTICEIMVSSSEVTKPRVKSRADENGQMHSSPMEDLWPFLPDDEFNSEMIIPSLR